jgi:hypothetical protein
VVRFFDPWVQFGLQFEAADLEASPLVETEDAATDEPLADDAAPAVEPAAKVVSLDQFRKK